MSNARALRGWRVTAQVLLLGVVTWVLGIPEAQHSVSAAPLAVTIRVQIVKQGAPLIGKTMRIAVKNHTDEPIAKGETDAEGRFSATVEPGIEYEVWGQGDGTAQEFEEWNYWLTPSAQTPVVDLPVVDVWYDGLVAPADGATVNRDQLDGVHPHHLSMVSASASQRLYRLDSATD